MKRIKSLYAFVAGVLMLSACNNELPTFDDRDAFVAFTNTSMSVNENVTGGELQIPVLLTSLAGLEGSAEFEIIDNTAKQGTHFTLVNGNNTLQFTKDAPTQYITIKVTDDDEFGGDVNFTINLVSSTGANIGASSTCSVTIVDNEHPLNDILGTYNGAGESYFGGALSWTLTLTKDESDLSTVWISNMVPGGSGIAVYGTVNEDHTELRIPVDQDLTSDGSATLRGLDPLTEEYLGTGEYIIGVIDVAAGTITINNAMCGSEAASGGFYEIVLAPSVWTKQ